MSKLLTSVISMATSWAWPLAFCAFMVISGAGLSYWAGDHNRNNSWLAKQAKVQSDAHASYTAEVKRGDTAVGSFIAEQQSLQQDFQNLTEKFNGLVKRVPLLASAGGGGRCDNRPALPKAPALADEQPVPDDGGDRLTAGAVWMWNSALTGSDQPTGACSAANTTQAACAAATGATLDDAWANHARNAQICAEDRLAHDRLIDLLEKRKAAAP